MPNRGGVLVSLASAGALVLVYVVRRSRRRPRLILGSSSIFRKAVLREAGYEFEVMKPDIDEKALGNREPGADAEALTLLIATAKASALARQAQALETPALVVCSDQVVVCDGRIREKPTTESEAREFLSSYSAGLPAETVTSVVVFDSRRPGAFQASGVHRARIWMRPIPEHVIDAVVAEGMVFKCAGGLMIENAHLLPYRDRVEGSEDSIRGMPVALMESLIRAVQST